MSPDTRSLSLMTFFLLSHSWPFFVKCSLKVRFAFIHPLGSHLFLNHLRPRHPPGHQPDRHGQILCALCSSLQPLAAWNSLVSQENEQIWDVPLKMFHGQSSDAGMFFSLFRWPQNRFKVLFMSPPVQGCHMCSDQSRHTQWRLYLSFEPRHSTWEQQKLLGFQKSDGSQATYYYFENLAKKAKCI